MVDFQNKFNKNKLFQLLTVIVAFGVLSCTQGGIGGGGIGDGQSTGGLGEVSEGLGTQQAGPAERPTVTVSGEQIPREFFDAFCKQVGVDVNNEPIYECDFGDNPDLPQHAGIDWSKFRNLKKVGEGMFVNIDEVRIDRDRIIDVENLEIHEEQRENLRLPLNQNQDDEED